VSADHDRNGLMAEARVARQEELIKLLRARGHDTSEATSMLAGMRYTLKVIRQQSERRRRFVSKPRVRL